MFNGKKYRELMDQHGLSEVDVGEHIGYTSVMVNHIIHGRRRPSLEQAVGMAELVGCTVDELIVKEA
ncbi:MAG: helix-turn-helix transcriptional regulator [Clostridia bacterium]|nr:helix-turn-helix transcriptional regulator [Clostridia bacterium]